MKILMVTTGMDIGGAETHISELCFALKKRGLSVCVASAGGIYASELQKRGIPHITLPLNRKNPTSLFESFKGLSALIRREKFDIVHAHARIPAFLCGKLRARYGFRFVTTDHLDFRVTPLLRRLTDWGELTFAVSEDLRTYLIQNYSTKPERIALTVNGIDTERFFPNKTCPALREELHIGDRALVLHVSRLEKHLSLCVRALMGAIELLNGQASLVVVGNGAYAQVLRDEGKKLNASLGYRAVIFVGGVTDVENYIAASDIVVSPSRAAMEAMACAKPTVICGSQGYGGIFGNEIIEKAVKSNFCFRGSVLPTPEILADDIRRILDMNKQDKAVLGHFARSFICERYSVDVMAQTQLDGYRKLLGEQVGPLYDILICGYYGYGNMGDETLLSVITSELRRQKPSVRICALSATPEKTTLLYNVDAVARFDPERLSQTMNHSKMLLFGGGNLLQDQTSTHSLLYYTHILRMAKKRGLKIFIYANGIGPLRNEENRRRTEAVLKLADSVSLRDTHSHAFVRKLIPQKSVRLTFDPAILSERSDFPIPFENYFVIVPKRSCKAFAQSMIGLIRLISQKTGLNPVLVSLYEKQDLPSVKSIASQTNAHVCIPKNAGECITLFSSAKLVVSSRLHALIYATSAMCPMVGYSDDEKIFSYLDYIGFGRHSTLDCRISASLTSEAAAEHVQMILEQGEYFKRKMSQMLPEWRALARQEIGEVLRLSESP